MDFLSCEPFELMQGQGTPRQPKQILLGFRQVTVPIFADGPASYQIIVLEGYENFPEVHNLIERGSAFWASSLNQVPQSQLQIYRQLKGQIEARGYVSLGKYHNAILQKDGTLDGDYDEGDVGIGDVLASEVISWEFVPGAKCTEDRLRAVVSATRAKMQLEGNDEVLLAFPAYRIQAEVNVIGQINCIDLSGQYIAYGEFPTSIGYEPLLALLFMNTQFKEGEAEFRFVDEQGQTLCFNNFTAIKQPFINTPGFDETKLRKMAIHLELVADLFDLSTTQSDVENFFF